MVLVSPPEELHYHLFAIEGGMININYQIGEFLEQDNNIIGLSY